MVAQVYFKVILVNIYSFLLDDFYLKISYEMCQILKSKKKKKYYLDLAIHIFAPAATSLSFYTFC